jgi:PIN domain nuclease of toxin-antitoxin system
MLIAQAKLEAMAIVSNDRVFESFGVPIVWSDARPTHS